MAGDRYVFRTLVKNLFKSLTLQRPQRQLMGEDYHGTKYYERKYPDDHHRKNKPERYFVPVNKDDFTQDIPAEWEAWLRFRRSAPPRPEEVNQNYRQAVLKKQNAKEIAAAYQKGKTGMLESNIKSERLQPTKFPVYKDYEKKEQ